MNSDFGEGGHLAVILSAWSGVRGIVSISGDGLASHSFGEIVSFSQTDMAWLVCMSWKAL